jgi:hypothetical protein
MTKKINVEINFEGLPEQNNFHRLAVRLEEEINNAVAQALCNSFENDRGVDFNVHVPSF